ncbi:hypothetical protein [Vibrio jasicida]|uniref:hypothetical protein n=1 Tax=Vibrio jasicida TaxID=766224 RepID=UPI0021575DD2|nr:hypothetical protein [Vibrio jasicida]
MGEVKDELFFLRCPFKFVFLNSFVLEREARTIPVQHLYFVTLLVDEEKKSTGTQAQIGVGLNSGYEAIYGFSKIDRLPIQVNIWSIEHVGFMERLPSME